MNTDPSNFRESSVLNENSAESDPNIYTLFVKKMPLWKRALDIFGSLIGLILFSPIFFLICLAIKITSPGPAFFKQERIGYGGRRFQFLKFRTMKVNADSSAHQRYLAELIKSSKDTGVPMTKLDDHNPQIIPFCKILRNTCLDELPQLINVFRGEMSLVGPRPPIPYEVDEYSGWHNWRFDVVPGMTGLWQVSGKNSLSFKEMVRLDIKYSRALSFLTDTKILMITPIAILAELMKNNQNKRFSDKGIEEHA
jgi:lipopolysaccharide/colanic/teichoic acid biosynthesis glycosyltransferase